MAGEFMNFVAAWIVVFSGVMAFVSFAAWRRVRSVRILAVAVAFVVFLVKGVVLSLDLVWPALSLPSWASALDLLILLFLSASVLKR